MKVNLPPLLAGMMLVATPIRAADLAANQAELHIEASGSVVADSAVLSATGNLNKRGKDACETAIAQLVATTRARLLAAALPASAVTLTASACEPADDPDGLANAFGNVQTVRETSVPNPAPATDAATTAALAANAAARERMKLPPFSGKVTVSARVNDLSKLAAVQRAVGFSQFGPSPAHIDYIFNHPDDVQGTALASALSKARKEADLCANALGYHVVRIARVSNHAGSPGLTDIVSLFAQLKGSDMELRLAATRTVSVAMDYVIAAN